MYLRIYVVHTRTYTYAHVYVRIHLHLYVHAHIHTYIHTYIHGLTGLEARELPKGRGHQARRAAS